MDESSIFKILKLSSGEKISVYQSILAIVRDASLDERQMANMIMQQIDECLEIKAQMIVNPTNTTPPGKNPGVFRRVG